MDERELLRSGPTYTIETLNDLRRLYPQAQLYLVIGEDQARALPDWHRIAEVAQAAIICVAQRADSGEAADLSGPGMPVPVQWRRLQMPVSELSATAIRNAVAHGLSVSHLVVEPVARYIEHHPLYLSDR